MAAFQHSRAHRPGQDLVSPSSAPMMQRVQRHGNAAMQERLRQRQPTLSEGAVALPFRAEMEAAFGEDLGDIAVLLGAAEEAGALGAEAAAGDEAIVFRDAQPTRETVAHELAHILQARGRGPGAAGVGAVDSSAEVEADQIAARVARGEPAGDIHAAPGGAIQRKPETKGVPAGGGGVIEIPVADGKKVSVDMNDGVKAGFDVSLDYPNGDGWGARYKQPIPCGMGGFYLEGKVSAKLAVGAGGSIAVQEVKEGGDPRPGASCEEEGTGIYTVTVGGKGAVKLELSGMLAIGGYIGAPFANLGGDGYFELSGNCEVTAGLTGSFGVQNGALFGGGVSMDGGMEAKLEAKGGARITYEALITSGEVGKWELFAATLGEAKLPFQCGADAFGNGYPPSAPSFGWMEAGAMSPTLVKRRPMTPEEIDEARGGGGESGGLPSYETEEGCDNQGAGGAAADCR